MENSSLQESYSDPENYNDILKQLSECKTHREVYKLISETFPSWLLYGIDRYSQDYPHLQKNWETICKMSNTKPVQIVLVDEITFDDNHQLVKSFCEAMTRTGYTVRRKEEFTSCPKCQSAIPNKFIWKQFKDRNLPFPEDWSINCQSC